MTNQVAYAPLDVQKMCKQAERDHETKKLIILMERVKRQIAERGNGAGEVRRATVASISENPGAVRLPSRSVPLER